MGLMIIGSDRRAQIAQLFIILSALLVIGATIFLGGKLIFGVSSSSCDVNDAMFMKSVTELVEDNLAYGSRNIVKISAPCDATAVCFVNGNVSASSFVAQSNQIINDSVKSGVKNNIFLVTRDTVIPAGYDSRILLQGFGTKPIDHEICIDSVSGEFTVHTQGYGRAILIS